MCFNSKAHLEVPLEEKKIDHKSQNTQAQNKSQLSSGYVLCDRYVIHEILGVGGIGSVYRARDMHFPSVEKFVAIKEIFNQASNPSQRKEMIQNFDREAGILATLDHPAIPTIFDHFSVDDRSYLVLDYIVGTDLESIISNYSAFLSEEKVINWGIELCDVLDYLHTHTPHQIIFRDIKPSNIMINSKDRVVLVDFGIAKIFQSGEKGTMIGTEGYSPPEQYRGDATPLVDIYALGATLHHALTKRDPRLEPPFSFAEREIRKINPQISEKLEEIITKSLQYEPLDRFPSAISMKTALLTIKPKSNLKSQENKPGNNSDSLTPFPHWSFECMDEIRGSPIIFENSIFFGSYDHHLYSLDIHGGTLNWSYLSEGGIVSQPAIHEGNIYFGSEDQRLHVLNLRNGKISWSYYTGDRIRSSPIIAEDHVFIGSDDACLHAINVLNGREIWNFQATSPIRSTPVIANDLICFGCESGDFYALNFRGEIQWNFKTRFGISSSAAAYGKTVFFCSMDSNIYALDTNAGWVNWSYHMEKGSVSSPYIDEGSLFVGSADSNIYAIDIREATLIWRYKTGHQVCGSPITHKENLYCGSTDGCLYCLGKKNGQLLWKFKTQGLITGSPIIYNDIIYFGSTDHHFYAIPLIN